MPLEDHRSSDPRDRAIRAALRDAALIAALLEPPARAGASGAIASSGEARAVETYLRVLRSCVADLGGSLDVVQGVPVATFAGHRIAVVLRRRLGAGAAAGGRDSGRGERHVPSDR